MSAITRQWSRIVLGLCALGALGAFVIGLPNLSVHGRNVADIGLYYGLPLAVMAALVAAMWLPRAETRAIIAISVVSSVISAYAAEAYLVFANSFVRDLPGAPHEGIDSRTKREVIADLRAQGIDAFPYLNPAYAYTTDAAGERHSRIQLGRDEIWPLGSIADATLVVCREGREYLVYKSDAHGFHNPPGIWNGQPTIAAVGDSYTHGECVPSNASFMGRIRSRHPATLNLGVSSTGPLWHLAQIREFLPELRPRVVLWFFFEGNDLDDLADEMKAPILRRYMEPGFRQNLRERQTAIDTAYRSLVPVLDIEAGTNEQRMRKARWTHLAKLENVRLLLNLVRVRATPPRPETWTRFSAILEGARDTVRTWGGELVFVYIPGWTRYHPQFRHGQEDTIRKNTLDIVQALSIPVVDAQAVIEKASDHPINLYQGHFVEAGNALVADAVLARIEPFLREKVAP